MGSEFKTLDSRFHPPGGSPLRDEIRNDEKECSGHLANSSDITESNMEKISAQVVIYGWVQGVYFRAYTRDQAQSLGLTGWVRNLRNGTVEAYFEGSKEKVEQMVAWCHRGSPSSQVERVEVTYGPYSGAFDSFQIRTN